jgi:hypothetical protein
MSPRPGPVLAILAILAIGGVGLLAWQGWRGAERAPVPAQRPASDGPASARRHAPVDGDTRRSEPNRGPQGRESLPGDTPGIALGFRLEKSPEGDGRDDRSLDLGRSLALAEDPSIQNVTEMVRRVFSLDDPRSLIDDAVASLTSSALDFDALNAACLLVEAALSVYHSESWRALHGDLDGPRLVESLLRRFPSLADEAAHRLARVLADGGYVASASVDSVEHVLATRPLPPGSGELARGLAGRADDFLSGFLDSDEPVLRAAAVRALVSMDEGSAGPLVAALLESAGSADEQYRILDVVAANARGEVAWPILADALRRRDGFADSIGPHAWSAWMRLALREVPEGDVRRFLATEGDPDVRRWTVGGLGAERAALLAELAGPSSPPDVRAAALVRLSSVGTVAVAAERLAARARELGRNERDWSVAVAA